MSRAVGRLHQPDHHILAALLAAAAFVEHAVGFADTRSISEEDFEAAAPLAPLGVLHAAQEFLGTGALMRTGGHLLRIPAWSRPAKAVAPVPADADVGATELLN